MTVVDAFIEEGIYDFGTVLDAANCARLLQKIEATRDFGEGIFLTEAEFEANPQYKGTNPRPGRNLLEALEEDLAFIEQCPELVGSLTDLLGDGYETLNKKVVCGVPESRIPEWIRQRILGNAVNNLGPYIRPEYRDITYFYGIDYHQDIIDWSDRTADFVTLYVYLSDVGMIDAPLYIIPQSHRFGATVFPHKLEKLEQGKWLYTGDKGHSAEFRERALIGPAGYVAMWHSALLHGTMPTTADQQRISLRYLYSKALGQRAGIDQVNETLQGALSLPSTRVDLDEDGSAVVKANIINQNRV
jgi:hypothetical protein